MPVPVNSSNGVLFNKDELSIEFFANPFGRPPILERPTQPSFAPGK